MNLFAVFQEGVYRHTCIGIFEDYPKAVQAADDAAVSDVDSYHSYDVFMFELNKPDCEESAKYSVGKDAALKKRGPHAGECDVKTDYYSQKSCCSRGAKGCVADRTAQQRSTSRSEGGT